MTDAEFLEWLYRTGRLLVPTQSPMTPQERAELERLIDEYSEGQPLSEILLEERHEARDEE